MQDIAPAVTQAPYGCSDTPDIPGSYRPANHIDNAEGVEASLFDIGTTSIRLVRAGNIIQILISSSIEVSYLYRELAERHKRAAEKLKGGPG